jgi:hypothetical protein
VVVDEWGAVVGLYRSEPVIGNVALKAAGTTTLPKMSAVSGVVPAVQAQQLWPTLVILLQWILHQIMEWDQGQ